MISFRYNFKKIIAFTWYAIRTKPQKKLSSIKNTTCCHPWKKKKCVCATRSFKGARVQLALSYQREASTPRQPSRAASLLLCTFDGTFFPPLSRRTISSSFFYIERLEGWFVTHSLYILFFFKGGRLTLIGWPRWFLFRVGVIIFTLGWELVGRGDTQIKRGILLKNITKKESIGRGQT